jgi:ketosteroid isomerase-like protein
MLNPVFAATALVLAAGAAHAQGSSPAEVVQRHVDSGGNLDAALADYADDAVVLQAGRTLQGKVAIRHFYEGMFGARPANPPATGVARPAGEPPKMTVDKVWQDGDVGFVNWHMGPVKATEEFVVRNGKIEVQAVFINGAPPAAPRS